MAKDKDTSAPQDDDENKAAEGENAHLDDAATGQRKRDIASSLLLFLLAGLAFAMPHLMYGGGPKYEHMLLVASDKLDSDENFHDTVVYLTQHGIGGAKGLIVNHPDRLMPYPEIYDMLGVRFKNTEGGIMAWKGGPVKTDKFTFLHTDDVRTAKSEDEGEGLLLTHESMEMVRRISVGEGPAHEIFAWGYSGWGPEQLETEMKDGKWYVIAADNDLIFHEPADEIYDLAMERVNAQKAAGQDPATATD